MSDVTDADREKAAEIIETHMLADPFGDLRGDITAALAEEREKARAPFPAVADELDRFSENEDFEWHRTGDLQRLGARDAYDVAVTQIRAALRAAEETPC